MVLNNTFINDKFISHIEFDSSELKAQVFMLNESSNKKFTVAYDNADIFLKDYALIIGGG